MARPLAMELWGRDLRYAILAFLLAGRGAVSIEEVLGHLESMGDGVWGSSSRKVVADALRYEVQRGRAVRVRRGWYRAGSIPRTTAWRMRHWRQRVLDRGWSRPPWLAILDDLPPSPPAFRSRSMSHVPGDRVDGGRRLPRTGG